MTNGSAGMDRVSPWMNAEVEGFRDAVRRFVATEVTPHQDRWIAQHHVDRELWNKAGALGMLLADVPEKYGGSGGTFAHQAVAFEELAAAGDSSFGLGVHAIVAHYLLNQGTEAQKSAYLPRLASGELVAAIAMSEPAAGSDLRGVRTRAVRTGEDYVINGSKTFITNGFLADLVSRENASRSAIYRRDGSSPLARRGRESSVYEGRARNQKPC